MDEGANARYLAPGYLVFTRGDLLMGAPLIEGVTRDEWFGVLTTRCRLRRRFCYTLQADSRLIQLETGTASRS